MSEPIHRHWNYRAIRFEHGEDSHIAIHEVHYQDGMPVAYSETPAVALWSVEEPDGTGLAILDRMREALVKPVLRESEFQASGRKLGFLPGLQVPENFDDPLPEEVLQTFEGPRVELQVRRTSIGTEYVALADVPSEHREEFWGYLGSVRGRLLVEGVSEAGLLSDWLAWKTALHATNEDADIARAKAALLRKLGRMIEDSGGVRDMAALSSWLDAWISEPHIELRGATPIKAMGTDEGRQQVGTLLERTRGGLPG